MLILVLFAFAAGVITILSPCILPLLPIILSGTVGEGKRRPFGIVTGFIASFTFFTLALSTIVRATGLPSDLLRNVAVAAIVLLGISMILPQTQLFLEKLFSKLSNYAPRSNTATGFGGGFVLGMSLGLVWAPCVGPILASVITLAATSAVNLASLFIVLAYSVGTALPMLAIMFGGRQLLQKNQWLLRNAANLQRSFGVVMILIGLAMFLQLDRNFQTFLLTKFPQYGAGLTAIENNDFVKKQLNEFAKDGTVESELRPPTKLAPDFTGGTGWINSQPLSLRTDLKGKVVLVDFWTYSCINCIRTMPYLRQWYDAYKEKGFVIVGVHSPEFEFEKKTQNVEKAVQDFQLTYPIVQDNNFAIWTAYTNSAWPSHYLIDKEGYVRYVHIGEGSYDKTEEAIRVLLGEDALKDTPMTELSSSNPNPNVFSLQQTPETYLGWGRAQMYAQDIPIKEDVVVDYPAFHPLDLNQVGLQGSWTVEEENITSGADNAKLAINYSGKNVYLVMDTADGQPKKVQVFLDGEPVTTTGTTQDMVTPGVIVVDSARKYDVVSLPSFGRHNLELIFEQGTQAFAFTYGN